MKPTKEQLELAAKAAGIEGEIRYRRSVTDTADFWFCRTGTGEVWQPITDKSDSFDLMVACKIDVKFHRDVATDANKLMWAVFLCAVEIGRAM